MVMCIKSGIKYRNKYVLMMCKIVINTVLNMY